MFRMLGIAFVGRDIIRTSISLIAFSTGTGVPAISFPSKCFIPLASAILTSWPFSTNFLEIIDPIDPAPIIPNLIMIPPQEFVYKRIILLKVAQLYVYQTLSIYSLEIKSLLSILVTYTRIKSFLTFLK